MSCEYADIESDREALFDTYKQRVMPPQVLTSLPKYASTLLRRMSKYGTQRFTCSQRRSCLQTEADVDCRNPKQIHTFYSFVKLSWSWAAKSSELQKPPKFKFG
eukprot:3041427-Amphidinium_carterae.2